MKKGLFPEVGLFILAALVILALLITALKAEWRGYLAASFDFTNPLLLLFGALGVGAVVVAYFKMRGHD
jgi:hypothetical protein